MGEIYTTGTWTPKPGRAEAFVHAWTEFATWAATMPGAGTLRLTRDTGGDGRFLSLGRWESEETVHAWKRSPEFRELIGRVLEHMDGFEPKELAVVATAASGAAVQLA